MKRIHIHIAVDDLASSSNFYTTLFDEAPTVSKPDYIKWQLEDPRVNLSITQKGVKRSGVDHLGIQVDNGEELTALQTALSDADIGYQDELGANCCYAQSDKYWTKDPQGLVWELFHSHGKTDVYGDDQGPTGEPELAKVAACCG